MARIRSVSPDLRTSETVAQWDREVRYAWVLLWGYLDDYGRGQDNARVIVADLFPLDDDVTHKTMGNWLDLFVESGAICRYEVDGKHFLHATKWDEYQKPQHKGKVRVPPCPVHEPVAHRSWSEAHGRSSRKSHEGLMRVSPESPETLTHEGEGEREEELEREGEPPRAASPTPPTYPDHCPNHAHVPIPGKCGDCKDQRKANEALGIRGPHLQIVKAELPPWCGDCNGANDRHRETPVGVIRCPECNPLAEVG